MWPCLFRSGTDSSSSQCFEKPAHPIGNQTCLFTPTCCSMMAFSLWKIPSAFLLSYTLQIAAGGEHTIAVPSTVLESQLVNGLRSAKCGKRFIDLLLISKSEEYRRPILLVTEFVCGFQRLTCAATEVAHAKWWHVCAAEGYDWTHKCRSKSPTFGQLSYRAVDQSVSYRAPHLYRCHQTVMRYRIPLLNRVLQTYEPLSIVPSFAFHKNLTDAVRCWIVRMSSSSARILNRILLFWLFDAGTG